MSHHAPKSEYSQQFLDGMLHRVAVSYHKYGPVKEATSDFLRNVQLRINKYHETKNTEFLVDAANFLMFEFMNPSESGAYFQPTDSNESPGLIFHGSSRPIKGTDNRKQRSQF